VDVYRPDHAASRADPTRPPSGFVIPVSVDDLVANGLLDEDAPPSCWERSLETLGFRPAGRHRLYSVAARAE
jgi:hypothetical protein